MTSAQLEVQIFGVKKSADTRKAQRFFSERRIRAHFVDLVEKPMSEGELRRFVDKFGIDGVVDRDSRRFYDLGLRHANINSARWLERLCMEPELLRLPLVRRLGKPPDFTIGPAEAVWKSWLG